MDVESAKQEFRRLIPQSVGSKQILELLFRLRERADLTPDDAGWVLWNLCDWYALKGSLDARAQHRWQSEFFELVKRSFPERAHWVVCDGTQANGLIHGGFLDFWWGCYQFANDNAPRVAQNRTVRFEAHRANVAAYRRFGESWREESARQAMASLLDEDPEWRNRDFGRVTYMTQLFELYSATRQASKAEETGREVETMLDDWLQQVAAQEFAGPNEQLLFGSWQAINADRPPELGLSVGMMNAACAFVKAGWFATAERLFRIQRERGRTGGDYCEALFLLSCWRNGHSKDEIVRMLNESKNLSPGYLIEIAPEMAEIVQGNA